MKAGDDPAHRDLAWVGHDPRAAAPAIALAAIANALVLWGRWYLEDLSGLADRVGALTVFALAWAVWPGLAAVFLYRCVTYTYRLTDRAVLADFGFCFRPVPPIALPDVIAVVAGGGLLMRWFGIGWVEVRTKDRTIRLVGVRHPGLLATKIRNAVQPLRNVS